MIKGGKMKKIIISCLILIILVIGIIFSTMNWKDKQEDNNLTHVNVSEVAHSIFYAPQYLADSLGYFEEEGIDLEVTTGFGADKVTTALISGDADIGFMGPEATIYLYNEGSEDYAVNFAQLTQRAGNFVVSRKKQDNFKWEELKGKEIIGGRPGVVRLSM